MRDQGSDTALDDGVIALRATLPARPTAVVIGSTSFFHDESSATCPALGRLGATVENLVLITGGMPGIGEGVGWSFFEACGKKAVAPEVFHILSRR